MPVILPATTTPLYRQIIARIAQDTDPPQGILAALGNGASSIYPNYDTDGPSPDRTACPTPFLLVASLGKKKLDLLNREEQIAIEVHDDPDQGVLRWPGLLLRLKQFLLVKEWRPTNDDLATFRGGLYYDSESPPEFPDQRYNTTMTQLILCCQFSDVTSGRGQRG